MRHILIAVLLTVLVVWRRKAIRDGSEDSVKALTYGLWVGAVITVIDISGSLMGFWQ